MISAELKPCPFCGEPAAFRWSCGTMLAECTGCGVSKGDGGVEALPMGDGQEFHRAAAERWNRRAQGLSQEDREALERDAARYRWLREPERGLYPDSVPVGRPFICIYHGSFGRWTGEHADREIDAAILRRLGGTM